MIKGVDFEIGKLVLVIQEWVSVITRIFAKGGRMVRHTGRCYVTDLEDERRGTQDSRSRRKCKEITSPPASRKGGCH